MRDKSEIQIKVKRVKGVIYPMLYINTMLNVFKDFLLCDFKFLNTFGYPGRPTLSLTNSTWSQVPPIHLSSPSNYKEMAFDRAAWRRRIHVADPFDGT